ncbi:hypothetical protein STTU_1742 [Streptomyces sp. Tu6071]|nr:hypothetical protein STTU_1742 [Streptomyces sp. Tu6071]
MLIPAGGGVVRGGRDGTGGGDGSGAPRATCVRGRGGIA